MSDVEPNDGTPPMAEQRCGFIAVIGAPNAGKSTLVNAMVGAKVSIVSHKVQTTRVPVRGIANEGDSQLIFVDTPGVFAPKKRLDTRDGGSRVGRRTRRRHGRPRRRRREGPRRGGQGNRR